MIPSSDHKAPDSPFPGESALLANGRPAPSSENLSQARTAEGFSEFELARQVRYNATEILSHGNFPYLEKVAGFTRVQMEIHIWDPVFMENVQKEIVLALETYAKNVRTKPESALLNYLGNAANTYSYVAIKPEMALAQPEILHGFPKFARLSRIALLAGGHSSYHPVLEFSHRTHTAGKFDWIEWLREVPH